MIRALAACALALAAAIPAACTGQAAGGGNASGGGAAAASADPTAVATTEGPVTGERRADGTIAFRGIPYARPPVGPLRWKAPQPIRWTVPRAATDWAPACAQADYGEWNRWAATHGSEDCLYLNVRTPSLKPDKPLPVMVWIHGGGNRAGVGNDVIESTLPGRGIVVVSFNYRLGALGFLSHPALSAESPAHASGNYGLMDQQAALRWVKANIARFGGDPARITIFGESAGGQDVGLQTLLPASRGLFARAIEESGTPGFGVPPRTLAQGEELGRRLLALAGAPEGVDAAALRRLPLAAILKANDSVHVPTLGDDSFIWLQMTVDGVVLPDTPARLLASNRGAVPLIIGSNIHEFTTGDIGRDAHAVITTTFGAEAPAVLAYYGLDKPGPVSVGKALDIGTDLIFRCPADVVARTRAAGGAPVWVYIFDHVGPDGTPVNHASEIPSMMMGGTGGAAPLQAFWANFARTGDPNAPGLPDWPRFSTARRLVMHFGQDNAEAMPEPAGAVCSRASLP